MPNSKNTIEELNLIPFAPLVYVRKEEDSNAYHLSVAIYLPAGYKIATSPSDMELNSSNYTFQVEIDSSTSPSIFKISDTNIGALEDISELIVKVLDTNNQLKQTTVRKLEILVADGPEINDDLMIERPYCYFYKDETGNYFVNFLVQHKESWSVQVDEHPADVINYIEVALSEAELEGNGYTLFGKDLPLGAKGNYRLLDVFTHLYIGDLKATEQPIARPGTVILDYEDAD